MKKKIFLFPLITALILFNTIQAQELTQTIKGKIIDNESQVGLPGATIVVLNSEPLRGTISDKDGYFRLDDVLVGRISLKLSFIGYEDMYISDLSVNSGKEISLNIELKESFSKLDEVVIKANQNKEEALNKMAT